MIDTIIDSTEVEMEKCFNFLKTNINVIRTNRINPNLLDQIKINCYGTLISLNKCANIAVYNQQTLVVTPFDNSLIKIINKEILKSGLDVTPYIKDIEIYVPFPPLTEERRNDLIKLIKNTIEQGKISLRNIRRNANQKVKNLIKDKIISKNEEKIFEVKIKYLTEKWINKLNILLKEKESEVMIF